MPGEVEGSKDGFDFDAHRRSAVSEFALVRSLYEDFAWVVRDILQDAIERKSLKISSIEARAKKFDSFGEKAITPSDRNPEKPKYLNPMEDITDLAGVRIITFFPRHVELVGDCIREEFDVVECVDHVATRQQEERLGYLSVHYLIRLKENRTRLPEYKRFATLIAEVQVRTVMQHAWAEIEHDVQYKSSVAIPQTIRRRLMAVAGLLEIADREFQSIQDADTTLRKKARESVELGQLEQVEITPDALRAYLDKRLGPDDRIGDYSYEFTAEMLRQLGFSNFKQVDDCIIGYDDDVISRKVHGTRRGQIERFELMLQAGMGDSYFTGHPWCEYDWFQEIVREHLSRMKKGGVRLKTYSPPQGASEQAPHPVEPLQATPPIVEAAGG
jgi:ppGpp synthetase/RelA/SpoT-type nucleotidyltranferase